MQDMRRRRSLNTTQDTSEAGKTRLGGGGLDRRNIPSLCKHAHTHTHKKTLQLFKRSCQPQLQKVQHQSKTSGLWETRERRRPRRRLPQIRLKTRCSLTNKGAHSSMLYLFLAAGFLLDVFEIFMMFRVPQAYTCDA